MKSERKIYFVIACVLCLTVGILAGYLPGYYSCIQNQGDILTQVSTFNAGLNGFFDGVITYGDLKEYGDFGLGTFEGLDGEMVALDGNFYCPDYFEGLNVIGYHLHFITKDKFNSLNLTKNRKEELEKAEKYSEDNSTHCKITKKNEKFFFKREIYEGYLE